MEEQLMHHQQDFLVVLVALAELAELVDRVGFRVQITLRMADYRVMAEVEVEVPDGEEMKDILEATDL
jgi:hypothetical protein